MAVTTVPREADRLPWLTEEKPPRKGLGVWARALLGILGMAAIAGLFYWIGLTNSLRQRQEESAASSSAVRVNVPPVGSTNSVVGTEESMPEVELTPAPPPVALPRQDEVRPAFEAPGIRRAVRRAAPVGRSSPVVVQAAPKEDETPKAEPLRFSNPWESAGASGKMVRVGTYSSLKQGKQAWTRLAKVFPGMKRLPAVVTDIPSLRNGRTYYRLQIGTTSQAHSEVLCQRMRAIGQSCVVVDLAGARGKGSADDGQPAGL